MADILVAYYSRTGNTRMIAEAIFSVLPDEKEISTISDDLSTDSFDLIFCGFPVISHSIPYAVELFLKRLPKNKKTALFSTHGSLTGSRLSRQAIEYASTIAAGTKILGTFSCRGKVSHAALESMRKTPEHAAWVDMAASAAKHPDARDMEDAAAFAKWVMTLYSQPRY